RGRFELVNHSDRPLDVALDPHGFRVDESGEVHDLPLPESIQVTFSASRFRIPPHQTRMVFYRVSSSVAPAWVVVYAHFTGYPRAQTNGVMVQLELPHYVYVLPKTTIAANDIVVREAGLE